MKHRKKASMLPEWLSGLSPLLTTATIYLKDPDHMTQKYFSTLKFQCACCSQPNSNTRTITRHQCCLGILFCSISYWRKPMGSQEQVIECFRTTIWFENLWLNYKPCWPCTVDTTLVAEGCAENLLYYKNKHNLKKNPFPVDRTEHMACIPRTSPAELNLFVCNLPFCIFQ